jgi:hypothetical protein
MQGFLARTHKSAEVGFERKLEGVSVSVSEGSPAVCAVQSACVLVTRGCAFCSC